MIVEFADWSTRIWTLQEATFPKDKLYIACADGIKHVNTIIQDCWDQDGLTSRSLAVGTDETMYLQSMLCFSGTTLIKIVEAFHNRTTTRPEDEMICLAILVGVQVKSLPANPTISDVLTQLPGLQQDIVFASRRRCDVDGLRWCPESFISATRRKTYEPRQSVTQLGPRGILRDKYILRLGDVEFTGMQPSNGPIGSHYLLVHLPGDLTLSNIVVFYDIELGASPDQLVSRHLSDASLVFEKTTRTHDEQAAAVLASNTCIDDGIFQAHYECLVLTVPTDYVIHRDDIRIGVKTPSRSELKSLRDPFG